MQCQNKSLTLYTHLTLAWCTVLRCSRPTIAAPSVWTIPRSATKGQLAQCWWTTAHYQKILQILYTYIVWSSCSDHPTVQTISQVPLHISSEDHASDCKRNFHNIRHMLFLSAVRFFRTAENNSPSYCCAGSTVSIIGYSELVSVLVQRYQPTLGTHLIWMSSAEFWQ